MFFFLSQMTHVRKKKVNMIIDILHSGLFFLEFQRTPFFQVLLCQ